MMRQKLLAFILPLAVAGILGFLFHQKMKTEKERTTTTTWEDDGQLTHDDTAGEVQMDEAPTQNTQDGYSPQQQKEEEGEDTTDVIDDRVPSDESLLEDARKLTANPILRLALTQEGILRIFVRFVDNAANGVLDESVKPLLGNYDAFKADVNRDGYLAATQSTTQRFTPLVAALTSIPPKDVATWLRKAEPRLQEILREMGYANTTFQSILTDATANILQIPIFNFEPEVVATERHNVYEYKDEVFQRLNDFQKALVRLGSKDCQTVRNYMNSLAKELELFQ